MTLSVIMPVWNTASWLEESLRSVLEQDFADLELICVDDGSTDDSPAILKRAAERDARRCGDPGLFKHHLGQLLVHGKGAADVAAAGILHAAQIQISLQPAVFALRAVERQKDEIRSPADFQDAGTEEPDAAALGAKSVYL